MWPNPQESADLVKFTEETLDGKLHFLCNENFAIVRISGNTPWWNSCRMFFRCLSFIILSKTTTKNQFRQCNMSNFLVNLLTWNKFILTQFSFIKHICEKDKINYYFIKFWPEMILESSLAFGPDIVMSN